MPNPDSGRPVEDCRILIVEDDFLLATSLKRLLEKRGCRDVGLVATVDKALAKLETEAAPDVAILDVNLNGETTPAVAQALTARNVPFVVVTGYGQDDLEAEVLRHAAHLDKPIRADELFRVITALVAPAPSSPPSPQSPAE